MKKALIVGIDNYPYSPLYSCVNDAVKIAELLEADQDGSKNFDVKIEVDIFTKSVLRTHLVDLFSGNNETVVFYFSGHGMVNELGGYIVTPDRKKYDEGILMDEILKLANNSNARSKIIILDCCYSGAMGSPAVFGTGASYINEGVTILAASRHNEPALAKKDQSIFTALLIEALKGGAANINGQITAGSIYAFIDQSLGPFDQRPVFKTNTTWFTALRKVTPQVPADVLKKIAEYFPVPDSEYRLDPSYEDTNTEECKSFLRQPYANEKNVTIFKHLQKLQSVGLVVPVDAPFMFFAAMDSKSCKLTTLGLHYWALVKNKRI